MVISNAQGWCEWLSAMLRVGVNGYQWRSGLVWMVISDAQGWCEWLSATLRVGVNRPLESFFRCRETWWHLLVTRGVLYQKEIHLINAQNKCPCVQSETISVHLVSSCRISFNYNRIPASHTLHSVSYPSSQFIFPREVGLMTGIVRYWMWLIPWDQINNTYNKTKTWVHGRTWRYSYLTSAFSKTWRQRSKKN